jgi:hypothetical protein
LDTNTVFYTPSVVHTPAQVERDIAHFRSALRSILVENTERTPSVHLDEIRTYEREQEDERQRRIFTELDWFADPPLANDVQMLITRRGKMFHLSFLNRPDVDPALAAWVRKERSV